MSQHIGAETESPGPRLHLGQDPLVSKEAALVDLLKELTPYDRVMLAVDLLRFLCHPHPLVHRAFDRLHFVAR